MRQLHPGRTARETEQPFTITLIGARDEELAAMRESLLGPAPSAQDIARADQVIKTCLQPADEAKLQEIQKSDFILAAPGADAGLRPSAARVFSFDPEEPERSIRTVIESGTGTKLRLALARCLPAFRAEVVRRIVRETSRENALFVMATALGNVVPNVFQPFLGVAEAAGDIVFLTANQVRMLFVTAAVHGVKVGYTARWREITSIIGAAFGWRSLARNLVSKIPFGGGLVPKGAVAYAGTTVIGEGLMFLYTTGRRMTRHEVRQAFNRAYSEAVETVRSLVGKVRPKEQGKGGDEPSSD